MTPKQLRDADDGLCRHRLHPLDCKTACECGHACWGHTYVGCTARGCACDKSCSGFDYNKDRDAANGPWEGEKPHSPIHRLVSTEHFTGSLCGESKPGDTIAAWPVEPTCRQCIYLLP